MALIEIKVPDIGDFKDVAVIELLVKAGDTVKAEQSLVTVDRPPRGPPPNSRTPPTTGAGSSAAARG